MSMFFFYRFRGKEGEHIDSMFMEKADGIVKKHFKDMRDFKATWLVKVTWENMTLYGHKDQVKNVFYSINVVIIV